MQLEFSQPNINPWVEIHRGKSSAGLIRPYEDAWIMDLDAQISFFHTISITREYPDLRTVQTICQEMENFQQSLKPGVRFTKIKDQIRDGFERHIYEVFFYRLKIGEILTAPGHKDRKGNSYYRACWRMNRDLMNFLQMPDSCELEKCKSEVKLETCKYLTRLILHEKHVRDLPKSWNQGDFSDLVDTMLREKAMQIINENPDFRKFREKGQK